ncbi:hypothetical protein SAV14893_049100 [Streptomyces avermitilis]|uniref:Uncharacterized protein n=1 Tax=Streptomyces avermitilis TaxID=33903 RepID=A0A4D4M1J3_STRAX|nr:hypothetical protein SAV14893_049100 [Streptomyces avermitilis]
MSAHALDHDLEALAASARAVLLREIDASGAWDADPRWREAFETVPRHLFVPYYYAGAVGGYERLWRDSPDPRARERWVRGAYADARWRPGCATGSWCPPAVSPP